MNKIDKLEAELAKVKEILVVQQDTIESILHAFEMATEQEEQKRLAEQSIQRRLYT